MKDKRESAATMNAKQNGFLVIIAALLIISPWPIFGLSIKPKSSPYIVAVPSDGTRLSSNVSTVFGRSPYFLIVDTKKNKFKILENKFRTEKHAVGLRIAYLLLNEKVGIAIAKNIGPEPYNNLTARNIQIYVGNPSTVRDAINQLKNNMLRKADKPTVQIHFGLEQHQVPTMPRSNQSRTGRDI